MPQGKASKARTTKVLPNEAEQVDSDSDEELEADVSHHINLGSRRHFSMVRALYRKTIRRDVEQETWSFRLKEGEFLIDTSSNQKIHFLLSGEQK